MRKFDSLRGKYLCAYVDCLRLCQKKTDLETLLRSVISSKRDLPAWFQATVNSKDGKPEKPHTQDTLLVQNQSPTSFTFLTGLKRHVNSAMAQTLIHELLDNGALTGSKESQLKLAYACYLRLNCSIEELRKTDAWRYEPDSVSEVGALCLAFTKLYTSDTKLYLSDCRVKVNPNDWSGGGRRLVLLESAIKKCKELFPTTSGAFFSKKSLLKAKNQQSKTERRGGASGIGPVAGTRRCFEVEVPRVGETFTTTVMAAEVTKRVKLTVPSVEPGVRQFSVDDNGLVQRRPEEYV